eukprot:3073718-Lingulodinium_polyedra.AAC.1
MLPRCSATEASWRQQPLRSSRPLATLWCQQRDVRSGKIKTPPGVVVVGCSVRARANMAGSCTAYAA